MVGQDQRLWTWMLSVEADSTTMSLLILALLVID
jgi:hypothetical protein